MSNSIDTNSLLLQLRSLAQQSGLGDASRAPGTDAAGAARPAAIDPERGVTEGAARTDFGKLVGTSLETVNARSQRAAELTRAYEAGHPDVELADVMIAVQKARVSFEALTQVRNKMVSAYQDVMNTPL